MHEQSESPSDVVSVLDEYASTLGDPDSQSQAQIEEERNKIRALRRHVLREDESEGDGTGQEGGARPEVEKDSASGGEQGQSAAPAAQTAGQLPEPERAGE